MKKMFSFAVYVMAAMAMALAMGSCKKGSETALDKKEQAEVGVTQNEALVQRILDFKNKVDERKANPGTKSGETIPLDEAMHNIVDLFNVTYTEPMAYYTESERHEFTLNVALTADGKVLVDDVVAAYEQALANAREAYHGSTLPDKAYQFLMVTCTPQRDGTAELKFDGKYGTRTDQPEPPTPHIDGPFGIGDDWHYLNGMGSCDSTCFESGADKVLQDTIMKMILASRPADPEGYRGFYTYFREKNFCAPLYSGVFYRTDVDDTCIGWQEMNDYLAGEIRNIYQVIPQEIGVNLDGNQMQPYRDYVYEVVIDGQRDEDAPFIRHFTEVWYARYNYIENGIIAPRDL